MNISVSIARGRNLIVGDITSSDPYCIVKHGAKTLQTEVVYKNLNPVWNEVKVFTYVPGEAVTVQVMDKDTMTQDDPLGVLSFKVDDLLNKGHSWIPLTGVKSGELEIAVMSHDSRGLVEDLPNCYFVNSNFVAGSLTKKKGEAGDHPTYQVQMHFVHEVFGDEFQGWNQHYDAAKKIFGPGPSAQMARKAIKTEFKLLYRRGGTKRTSDGKLITAADFFDLVKDGVREGHPRMFTYVLMDETLNFSETSANFFKDFMSKHAMHSNASPQVRYSGEFCILPGEKKTLIIDNNSGTYAPAKESLVKLKELFEKNFPNIQVEALDRQDPRLEQVKKEIGVVLA